MVKLIADYLNVQNFEVSKERYAHNNYNYQYQLGEHITLRLDGPLNDCYQKTCHLEMKGEGCRDFERRNNDKTWRDLFLFMVMLNAKFKRIDIAIDDYVGDVIDLEYLSNKIKNHFYTSIFKSNPRPIGTLEDGLTYQFGSNLSKSELVVYDKKAEQEKRKKVCSREYWVRYELRFRSDNAEAIATKIVTKYELQKLAYEQLYRMLDIKEDNSYSVREQSRVLTDSRWTSFLNNVEKGMLVIQKSNTIDDTMDKYMKTGAPFVSMYLMLTYLMVGRDPWIFEIEIFKFMKNSLKFSNKTFKRLNMYLNNMGLKPLDDVDFAILKHEFSEIIQEKELPF